MNQGKNDLVMSLPQYLELEDQLFHPKKNRAAYVLSVIFFLSVQNHNDFYKKSKT